MISLRGLIAVVFVSCAASIIALPEHVTAGVEYFPVPSVSSTRNDGNDAGLLVPILITDPDG